MDWDELLTEAEEQPCPSVGILVSLVEQVFRSRRSEFFSLAWLLHRWCTRGLWKTSAWCSAMVDTIASKTTKVCTASEQSLEHMQSKPWETLRYDIMLEFLAIPVLTATLWCQVSFGGCIYCLIPFYCHSDPIIVYPISHAQSHVVSHNDHDTMCSLTGLQWKPWFTTRWYVVIQLKVSSLTLCLFLSLPQKERLWECVDPGQYTINTDHPIRVVNTCFHLMSSAFSCLNSKLVSTDTKHFQSPHVSKCPGECCIVYIWKQRAQ